MITAPECYKRKCRHFKGVKQDGDDETTERVYCSAFPDGIPESIAYGDNKHAKPFPKQVNDIVYEKA
jgi:hypothetical protein